MVYDVTDNRENSNDIVAMILRSDGRRDSQIRLKRQGKNYEQEVNFDDWGLAQTNNYPNNVGNRMRDALSYRLMSREDQLLAPSRVDKEFEALNIIFKNKPGYILTIECDEAPEDVLKSIGLNDGAQDSFEDRNCFLWRAAVCIGHPDSLFDLHSRILCTKRMMPTTC